MGWASGSYLAQDLYDKIRKDIPKPKRAKVAETIISMFEHADADDWDNCGVLWKDAGRPVWSEEDE